MIPITRAIAQTTAALAQAGVTSPGAEARTLVCFAAGAEPSRLALLDGLDHAQGEMLAQITADRVMGTPLQHITGRAYFRTISVEVGPGVFIPRPETESLAGWAIGHVRPHETAVVELCAGSGAISVAIAKESQPGSQWAVEKSEQAYSYLTKNLEGTGVVPVLADMAQALPELNGTVDVVVANPPYIPESQTLPADVLHDPGQALFSGPDGLDAIRVVAVTAMRLLKPGGAVGCEHGDDQAEQVCRIFDDAGFVQIHTCPDMGSRPRFVTAVKPPSPHDSPMSLSSCKDGTMSIEPDIAHTESTPPSPANPAGPRCEGLEVPENIRPVGLDDQDLCQLACEVLDAGGCIVFPTDTVYGIAARPDDPQAVARLQSIKGRSDAFPPPILAADTDSAFSLVSVVPIQARRLGETFWPGALTLILPTEQRLSLAETVGTIGVRVPDLDPLRRLLRATGPLAVSSANKHDCPPATAVEEAVAQLGADVGLYIDGGPTPGPTPSTVVDCTADEIAIVRLGLLSTEQILSTAGAADA